MLKGDAASFLCCNLQLKGDVASFLFGSGRWMAVIGLGPKKFRIPIILQIFVWSPQKKLEHSMGPGHRKLR